MKQLTKEELDTMAWMDEAGIVLDADLMEMASRNWRNRNERFAEERRQKRDWSETVNLVCAVGIIAVCLVLAYTEYFA